MKKTIFSLVFLLVGSLALANSTIKTINKKNEITKNFYHLSKITKYKINYSFSKHLIEDLFIKSECTVSLSGSVTSGNTSVGIIVTSTASSCAEAYKNAREALKSCIESVKNEIIGNSGSW